MEQENKYGFDEVVDTACDLIEVQRDIRGALKDGFQLSDILVLYNQYPKLKEVWEDKKVFGQQLADLTPDESTQAWDQITARVGIERDKAERIVYAGLRNGGRAYRLYDYTKNELVDMYNDIEDSFKS
jgi:hypothetical protein